MVRLEKHRMEKMGKVAAGGETQNGKMKQDCLGSAIKQPAEVNCFKVGQQAQPKGKKNPDLLLFTKKYFHRCSGEGRRQARWRS